MDSSAVNYLFKMVIVGDSGVGKSQLLNRFASQTFNKHPQSTIGVEFANHVFNFDNENVKIHILDTAGQERYRAVTAAYYRGATAAMLVYDVYKRHSFDSIPRWLSELKTHADPNVVIMLVANKADKAPIIARLVSSAEGQKLAEVNNICFIETSALDDVNVNEAFANLANEVYKRRKDSGKLVKADETLNLQAKTSRKGVCCNN
jgi:small GTP-binding protein